MIKIIITFLLFTNLFFAQQKFSHRDSLQGGLRFERTCFDIQRYDLNIKINPTEKFIVGFNEISFKVKNNTSCIQLDLFENMQVDSIIFNHKKLNYKRDKLAVFIFFTEKIEENTQQKLKFYYSGNPIIAKNAPWDGGFVFSEDKNKKPWIGVACQGAGASLWFPCKDSQTDEPDLGATIKVAVPNGLMEVSNGKFLGNKDLKNGYTRWDWEVTYPINSYNITVNIADYFHFNEVYNGLRLDYYVLKENKEKAFKQFEVVKPMMDCFQYKFGEYPFKNDGYKLVETPYLGMEHQSAVSYGNDYKQGYSGEDLSGTSIGLLFDFIIIHESGHEWFGNSITSTDVADMWIHEAFTCYTESVFVECQFGYEKGQTYINGLHKNVLNDKPILGIYGLKNEGSGDMYYKGALMLNTIRHIINNDEKWWKLLLDFSNKFKYQLINYQDVVHYFESESGITLTPVFNAYLKYTKIPKLQVKFRNSKMEYRWETPEDAFEMPFEVTIDKSTHRLLGTKNWKEISANKNAEIQVNTNSFYISVEKLE